MLSPGRSCAFEHTPRFLIPFLGPWIRSCPSLWNVHNPATKHLPVCMNLLPPLPPTHTHTHTSMRSSDHKLTRPFIAQTNRLGDHYPQPPSRLYPVLPSRCLNICTPLIQTDTLHKRTWGVAACQGLAPSVVGELQHSPLPVRPGALNHHVLHGKRTSGNNCRPLFVTTGICVNSKTPHHEGWDGGAAAAPRDDAGMLLLPSNRFLPNHCRSHHQACYSVGRNCEGSHPPSSLDAPEPCRRVLGDHISAGSLSRISKYAWHLGLPQSPPPPIPSFAINAKFMPGGSRWPR